MFKIDCMHMAYEIKHVTKQYCIYLCVIHRVCMCVCVYMFRSVHASIVCRGWGGGGGMKLKECVCEREKVYIFVCQRGGERENTDIHKPNQCS